MPAEIEHQPRPLSINKQVEKLLLASILAVTFLVYAKSLWNDYTYDDKHYAAAYTMHGPNTMIIGDHSVSDYFTRPMGHDVQKKSRGFRPVTVLSYAWTHHAMRSRIVPPRLHPDYPENQIMQGWSDPAWPHHLINLVLHLLATFLAYRLVRHFAGPGIGALGAAAVFGLHALRSDQVVSIVGRGELLPFVFGAVGSLLYLHALQRRGRQQWLPLALVLPCTTIAFFSKESAIGWAAMMPLLALVSHMQRGESVRASLRRQIVPYLAVVVIPAVLFFLLRARMLELAEAFEVGRDNNLLFSLGLVERLPTAVMVWGHGLYKLCVPYPLACDYSRAVFDMVGYGNGWFLLSAAVLLAILAGGVWCFRRVPLLFLGMAALLGFGFITSNIPITIETIFGERLYYTPGLGLSFLVAELLGRSRKIVPIVLAMWLTASAGICVLRSFDWESNDTLFEADADNQPRSLGLQMNMARVCRLREDWFGRERYLDRALEIDPEYASARNDRAVDLMNEGQYEPALGHLLRALRALEKNDFDLQMIGPEIAINTGLAQQALERFDDAEKTYARVISLSDPKDRTRAHHDALLGLAWLAWRQGDVAAVEGFIRRCEMHFVGDAESKIYRGALAMDGGDPATAIGIIEPILSHIPQIPQSDHTAVGYETWIEALRATGKVDEAMEKAVHLGGLLHMLRRDRAARESFTQAIGHPRYRAPAYRGLAWVAWELEGPHGVDEVLKKAMPLAPRDPELAVHGAMLAFVGGDANTTVRLLPQLLRRMPPSRDFLRAWLVLGRAFLAVGDIDNARSLADGFVKTTGLPSEYKKKFVSFLAELDQTSSK